MKISAKIRIAVLPAAIISLLCFAGWVPAMAAEKYDCLLRWRSLKTDHFWIHYHQGLEEIAREMAGIAERVHIRLTRDMDWSPKFRTDVVLVDSRDRANAYASYMPYNRVLVYVSRPDPDSELKNYRNWLETAFIHEYSHILTIDQVNGMPYVIRHILGRINFPNQYLPYWAIEGVSVYNESRYSDAGRNNSTYTDMIMRMEIASGRFKSISEASHWPRERPGGSVPYLYGGLFVQYLEATYGENSISAFLHENADNFLPYSDNIYPIPYFFNKDAKDVYGRSFNQLWKEWKMRITEKQLSRIQAIKAEGITDYKPVTDSDNNSELPRFSPDGEALYYIRSSNRDSTYLVKLPLDSLKEKKLCRVHDPDALSVTSAGGLYLSDVEYRRSFSLHGEAFTYRGGYKKITGGLRVNFLSVSKDRSLSVFVRSERGRYSLIVSDAAFQKTSYLIRDSGLLLAYPAISSDGKKIVFTARDPRGYSDLFLLETEKGNLYRLTDDPHSDIQPVWHPGGNTFIFTSDRNGVYNLYEYSLKDKKLSRITNVLGGAFSPDISPDGSKIAFSLYEAKGRVVALMEYPARKISTEETDALMLGKSFFEEKLSEGESADNNAASVEAKRYNPLLSVFPSYFFPFLYIEEIYDNAYDFTFSLSLNGSDTLYRHLYSVTAYFTVVQKRATVSASYTYARLYPDITFGYYDSNLFYGPDDFPWENHQYSLIRQLERSGYVTLFFPLKFFRHSHGFQLSYIYEKKFIDEYHPDSYLYTSTEHHEKFYAHILAGYSFSDAQSFPYSISKERGREISLKARIFHEKIGSDSSFYRVSGKYSEYLPGFFRNNVFMLQIRAGISFDNPAYLSPYNLGRFERGLNFSPPSGEEDWGLRGYPAGSLYGDRIAASTIEYRFPMVQQDAGIMTVPVMFRDLWGKVFFDCGNIWDEEFSENEISYGIGAEVHLRLTLGYAMSLTTAIGYAYGFSKYGEHQFYFTVGSFMEGMINTSYF